MSSIDDLNARIAALSHAIQSGVAIDLQQDASSGTPKHLRVGVNMALVGNGALVRLLITKGVITEEEYLTELVAGLEAEKDAYEERLAARLGRTDRPIRLA